MVTLALETVTRCGSIAIARDSTFHATAGPDGHDTRTHGERLPGEMTDWLRQHDLQLSDVDRFVVVTGPGSFTGLRVGIAAVQGAALAAGRPVAGVPTLDALAMTWLVSRHEPEAVLVACLDGQRSEVFVAAWIVGSEAATDEIDAIADIDRCAILVSPAVSRPEGVAELLRMRPHDRPLVVVGDGAARYAGILRETLPDACIVQPAIPLAEGAARIATNHPELFGPPHAVRPVYLRRPDAELVRERTHRAGQTESGYRLRRADSREDLAAVEALQRQTFSNPWGAEAIRWELENTDVARLYVMHDEAGRLVAYCACWMIFDELHINSLAVDIERRRQGLARQLLTYVLGEAARSGASAATLEVRSSNQAARGLYEGMGFAVEGLRRDYYQDPREDAVILWNRAIAGRRAGRASR